jgi:hypothetical protein
MGWGLERAQWKGSKKDSTMEMSWGSRREERKG